MIWIRADANKEIGTGHVMRCLSIARALKQRGEQVCFLLADENALPLLESKGQEYRVLHSDYTRMEAELPHLKEMLKQGKPDFLLVDSYFVTAEYFREIREHVAVGYVDDKCVTGLPVDILLNYNIFAKRTLYGPEKSNTRYLLGLQYIPLREEFVGVDYEIRERVSQVLVTTGGSDKFNLAGQLLQEALSNPLTVNLNYCVVSGAYNVYLEDLRRIEEERENVKIYCNVRDMSRLMQASDIAVSAGGYTMYELSAVGVPVVCFSFVDNQERIVEGFREKELVCYAGNYLEQKAVMLTELVEAVGRLARDYTLRRDYSRKQRNIIDGRGAERLAEILTGLCGEDSENKI